MPCVQRGKRSMELIEQIVSRVNPDAAAEAVRKNKGAAGVDGMEACELRDYMDDHWKQIRQQVLSMKYRPMPVKRVYIPKPDGRKRPLGIPVAIDRAVQGAVKQVLEPIFDPGFSSSYGFRPGRSAHDAVFKALEYVNEGYEWIVDLDIEKFFDTVNHDKLISLIREKVNDKATLHLIRQFLRAGVMEEGKVTINDLGTPQGGVVSPLLANIYLNPLDKELESRGLRFCRYADDVVIFTRSEMAANRVMASVSSWLERKLFLKVSPTRTKVVRPSQSAFLGFTMWNDRGTWKATPLKDRRQRLFSKIKEVLCRRKAAAKPLAALFTKLNQILRGWINYFCIGSMRKFMKELGPWLRHKVRVVILKQWKKPKTIFGNLKSINDRYHCGFEDDDIYQTANSGLGLYRTAGMKTVNFILNPKVLGIGNRPRPGLINPIEYYNLRASMKV